MRYEEHAETLEGEGPIWLKGKVILQPARYEIERTRGFQQIRTQAGTQEIEGRGNIDGVLHSPFPFSLIGESIKLEIEDGRRWHCFIQSDSGRLVNREGIK